MARSRTSFALTESPSISADDAQVHQRLRHFKMVWAKVLHIDVSGRAQEDPSPRRGL